MECRVLSCGGAKGRHAKTLKSQYVAGFRVATFRVLAPVRRNFPCRGERSPPENPPNSNFGDWRVFAWRPFALTGKDTRKSRRKRNAWNVAYFRVAGRMVAMRKHEKVTIWRVFAWRLFAFSPRNTT